MPSGLGLYGLGRGDGVREEVADEVVVIEDVRELEVPWHLPDWQFPAPHSESVLPQLVVSSQYVALA